MNKDHFAQSLAGLSRSLDERAALHPDPVAEAMERRIAVQAEFAAREQRVKFILGSIAAGAGSAAVMVLILFLAWPPERQSSPVPPAAPPSVVAIVDPPVETVVVAPVASAQTEPAEQAPPPPSPQLPLGRTEVKEVQSRLLAFGFNPGPLDGSAGRMTQSAISNYQQRRGQFQTGKADRALLDQLRQDPAPTVVPPPQVAQRVIRNDANQRPPSTRTVQPRSDGPLAFLRNADANFSHWLQSLGR